MLLAFVKNFHLLLVLFFKERVIQSFAYCQSFLCISLQKSKYQAFGFLSNFFFELNRGFQNLIVKFFHSVTFEWSSSLQHSVKNNSCRPQVNCISEIAFVSNNFWCYVSWSSTLICLHSVLWRNLSYSKVSNLHMACVIQKNII